MVVACLYLFIRKTTKNVGQDCQNQDNVVV